MPLSKTAPPENAYPLPAWLCYNPGMLGEYKVGRCSRQCYSEKRPLKEGEWYYSVVLFSDDVDEYERRDYSAESWEGPPEGALGQWKCRMPIAGDKKTVLAPRAVLIDLLRQMESLPEQAKTRYLLALMLLRRRFVRIGTPPADDCKIKTMYLEVADDGLAIEVAECDIARSEAETLSETLTELLYCEASEIEQE